MLAAVALGVLQLATVCVLGALTRLVQVAWFHARHLDNTLPR